MNIQLIDLQSHGDERGALVALEVHKNIPFPIKRVYYLFDTQAAISRGFHAHKHLHQVVIAVKGSCEFILDDGIDRETIVLNNPRQGLFIPPGLWREMHHFSADCVLLVLADAVYSEADYIRDYTTFIQYATQTRKDT